MSKTIDVEAVDTWTAETKEQPFFLQHRNGKHRQVSRSTVSRWYDNCVEWPPISSWVAVGILDAWGYTITTPAAKDESPAKTETTPADLAATVKRVEERVNDLTKIVHGLQNSMPGYDKDVMVDEAVRRLDERLSKLEAATTPVPLWKSVNAKTGLTDEEEREAIALAKSLRAERDTPAKVRVVLPEMPGRFVDEQLVAGWQFCMIAVKRALSAAGIDVVKEASK